MTVSEAEQMTINTTWNQRLAQEPLKNLIRMIEWKRKMGTL
jgi:hypothetical protein